MTGAKLHLFISPGQRGWVISETLADDGTIYARSGSVTINPDDCGTAWWVSDESLRVVNKIGDQNSGNISKGMIRSFLYKNPKVMFYHITSFPTWSFSHTSH